MQLPQENASSDVLVNYGVYTAVRLEANGITKNLAPAVRNATATVKTLSRAGEDKAEDTTAAHAIRDAKEDDLDHAIMACSLEILSAVNNNRSDNRYKIIFVDTPTVITAKSVKDKIEYAKLLEERLKSNAKDKIYHKHQGLINKARVALDTAATAYNKSSETEQKATDKENVAKDALRTVLNKTHGKLIDLTNKKAAEAFFKKANSKTKKAVVVPPAKPAATNAGTNS